MRSKRSLEGEILIDHRASPGLSPEDASWMGVQPGLVAKGQLFEAPIITCSHCQAMVVPNTARTRDRAWCSKCDKYICDDCAALMHRTLECRDRRRLLDQVQEDIERGVSPLLMTKL